MIMNKILISVAALCMLASCGNSGTATEKTDKAMTVEEVIMSRRSIRKYKPQPVEREKMEKIALCGINAPNGQNKQSWEIRITDNPEFISAITDAYLKIYPEAAQDSNFVNIFRNAPTVAFIANDTAYELSQIDCGLLGGNMVLMAHAMGIGSCCLGSPVRFLKSAKGMPFLKELGFSQGYNLLYAIGFGYPDEEPAAKPRSTDKVKFL